MSIRKDLQAIMVSRHGGRLEDYDKTAAEFFDWLTSADVLVHLQDEEADVAAYVYAADLLRKRAL